MKEKLIVIVAVVALTACGPRNEQGETVDDVLDRTNGATVVAVCTSIQQNGYAAAKREWLAPATDDNPFGVYGPNDREFQEALFDEAASRC